MTTATHDQPEPGPIHVTQVHVDLPTEVWEKLTAYAATHDISKTAALRRAISLLDYTEMRPGSRLLCEEPGVGISELYFGDEKPAEARPLRWSWRDLLRLLASGGLPR